ncbi:MAG TPA: MarR family transcriptional regulator [Acidimicrobiales bacterium]|nr:MarR family transcriptional regulator [Acidimicrobiales bacterium]
MTSPPQARRPAPTPSARTVAAPAAGAVDPADASALAGAPLVEVAAGPDSELATRLRLAVTRLSRQLRQQAVGGLTASQLAALATVERLGDPNLGELAAAEGVRPPSMTRLVDGLTAAGLVERVVDAEDRRVARVRLTAEGRRSLQRTRSAKTAYLARRLRRLPDDERRALRQLVALLEHLVEEP